jgi:hypothetical protein
MTLPYAQEVEAGMAWLDEHRPDWLEVFVEDRGAGLHMEDCHRCVLGHVLGSYWHEDSPVRAAGAAMPSTMPWDIGDAARAANTLLAVQAAAPLGFCLPWDEDGDGCEDEDPLADQWRVLGDVWRAAIEKRLAGAGRLA